VVATEEEKQTMEQHIKFSIREARIDAEIHVLVNNDEDVVELLIDKSSKADLVFSGLARGNEHIKQRVEVLERIAEKLKMVVFTQNNGMQNDIPVIFSETNKESMNFKKT
jgi:hypothetical protein